MADDTQSVDCDNAIDLKLHGSNREMPIGMEKAALYGHD